VTMIDHDSDLIPEDIDDTRRAQILMGSVTCPATFCALDAI